MASSAVSSLICESDGVVVDLFRSRPIDVHRHTSSLPILDLVENIRAEVGNGCLNSRNGQKLLRLLITDLYLCWAGDPVSCLGVFFCGGNRGGGVVK